MEDKPNNPLAKFVKFWDSLSTRDQAELWDFLTALRGPDNDDPPLKFETTAIIRSFLLKRDHVCPADVNRTGSIKALLSQIAAIENKFDYNRHPNEHFLRHIKHAFSAINNAGLPRR